MPALKRQQFVPRFEHWSKSILTAHFGSTASSSAVLAACAVTVNSVATRAAKLIRRMVWEGVIKGLGLS